MSLPKAAELIVSRIDGIGFPSPLVKARERFVDQDSPILIPRTLSALQSILDSGQPIPAFEVAGPRSRLAFEPARATLGIVTCGGLCPGLNDVIRAIVIYASQVYGVRRFLGFRYGYAGLSRHPPAPPMELCARDVVSWHRMGGTELGTSRGPQDPKEMVDVLVERGVSALLAIGGDGTLRGACAIAEEVHARGLPLAVIGIPKTIDNDLLWTDRTFGFDTAVEKAREVLAGAHAEATAAWNGVGLVKLMGRDSGFIAAMATLSSGDVNFCLVPESPFELEGPGGLLEALERRLEERRHAMIVVAEGAGQNLFHPEGPAALDASGNVKLQDIGLFLRDRIRDHFRRRGLPLDLKYIDPSYTIRSMPADSLDAAFCLSLGHHAVHAALAGRTAAMIGFWNYQFVHVPMALAVGRRKRLRPEEELWRRVLGSTGQRL